MIEVNCDLLSQRFLCRRVYMLFDKKKSPILKNMFTVWKLWDWELRSASVLQTQLCFQKQTVTEHMFLVKFYTYSPKLSTLRTNLLAKFSATLQKVSEALTQHWHSLNFLSSLLAGLEVPLFIHSRHLPSCVSGSDISLFTEANYSISEIHPIPRLQNIVPTVTFLKNPVC